MYGIRITLLLAVLLFVKIASALPISYYQFQLGAYKIHFIYNNGSIATDKVALVQYDFRTKDVWFQTVIPESTTKNIACRRQSQERIVVGPIGCSDIVNPSNAIESSNCIPNDVDVIQRRILFKSLWYLSKDSNECVLNGGNGDGRICIGPVRLSTVNQDSFIPRKASSLDESEWPTPKDILSSTMVFVESLIGPFAMTPALTEIPIVLPAIRVTSGDCPSYYSQSYSSWAEDLPSSSISTVWKAFKGNQFIDRVLLLEKYSEGSFRIVLASTIGANGDYTREIYSTVPISYKDSQGRLLIESNWLDIVEFGAPYAMTGLANCSISLTIESPSSKFLLQDIYPVTSSNYTWNIHPRRFYQTRGCNYHIGRYDHSNNLVYSHTPAGDVGGGSVVYVHPDFPRLPVSVPPNPLLDHRLTCEEVNPQNESFLDHGLDGINQRSLVPRINVVQESCFTRFVLPEVISLNINPDEKYKQCQMMGGYTWGLTQSMCSIAITQTYCKRGYYYFNQKCYYKFNPVTETKYAVPIGEASTSCAELNPFAQALVEVDEYLQSYISGWFLYQKRSVEGAAMYRVPVYSSTNCKCFNSRTAETSSCNCYTIRDSNTTLLIFPICYYPITVASLEPQYSDISISLQTARLWRYGQEGPKPGGHQASCECFDGWTGKVCDNPTCPFADVASENPDDLNALTTFFRKCYSNKQGACWNGLPRVCKCNIGYGPHASIIDSYPELFVFKDLPCAFPVAVSSESGYMQLNDKIYPTNDPALPVVCSGTSQGIGKVDNGTNLGVCECAQRSNIIEKIQEISFDGKACSCEKPIIPAKGDTKNGLIISALCNHRGTCCPFGQSFNNPLIGDPYASECYETNGSMKNGCSCENGFGGESCTCPVPFDLAKNRIKETKYFGSILVTYVNLGSKQFVKFVKFIGCEPTSVEIANDIGKKELDGTNIKCVYNDESLLYECGGDEAFQFIVYIGSGQCTAIEAYEKIYQFCGEVGSGNLFSGRFYAIPTYRSRTSHLLQQYTQVSTYGCTNTDCFCSPGHGGKLCAARVSSIRDIEVIENDEIVLSRTNLYCGESVLVPVISDDVRGRGYINEIYNNCTCNAISNVDATGRIGSVQEKFTGSACECATGYNKNRDRVETCSGHGTCISATFPYGKCEADIINLEADALATPFVEKTSFANQFTVLAVTEDSFFYLDKLIVTRAPTLAPTDVPTEFPTTSPTVAPTINPTQNPTTPQPTQVCGDNCGSSPGCGECDAGCF